MINLARCVACEIKRTKTDRADPDIETTKFSPMTNARTQQKQNAADKPNRDPDRGTDPFLIKSVLKKKSDPDDQDQHTDPKEPFLADRQFSRTPSAGTLLPFGFDDRRWKWRR